MTDVRQITYVGIMALALIALSFTAAAVDTGLDPVGQELPGFERGGEPPGDVDRTGSSDDGGGPDDGESQVVRDANDDQEGDTEPSDGPALWQVVVGVVLVGIGGIAVVYGLTRGDGADVEADSDQQSPGSSGAADRIVLACDVAPTNEVYRVWLALREEVRPGDGPTTPAAIATAAAEQGFDEGTVRTLTKEFCAVRYGHASPTTEREQRARHAGEVLGIVGAGN